MKKTLSIILAILMIVTTMPFAFAADDYAVVDTEAGTVTIDGTLGGKTTATEDDVNALVEKLKGYVDSGITTIIVTGSEPALHNFYDIDTSAVSAALYYLADGRSDSPYCGTIDLILPDVTEIVDDEFNNTYALNSITLPKVTSVGDGAFYATIYLQKLTFGSVVTAIEQRSKVVFYYVGNKVGGCELILNCGQANEDSPYIPDFTANTWYDKNNKYFKSITLTHNGGEATCIAKAVCETCGEEYGEFDANKHTLVQKDANAPTCTEIGWDAYEYCTACDYSTYVELPAITHIDANCDYKCDYNCGYVYETLDFSDAKILTVNDANILCIDGVEVNYKVISGIVVYQYIPAGKYKLASDISILYYNTLFHTDAGSDVVIDLNGYTWSSKKFVLYVQGSLSIYDTSAENTGKIISTDTNGGILTYNGAREINLYNGTLENIDISVSRDNCVVNLYGGKIKCDTNALICYMEYSSIINIYDTVLETSDGVAHIDASIYNKDVAKAVINVADYSGDGLTIDAWIDITGKFKLLEGIENAEEAEKYTVNYCSEFGNCFLEKTEYDETTGELYVYVVANAFTQQPSAENGYTVDFNNSNATFQWYEAEKIVLTPDNVTAIDEVIFENEKWLHGGWYVELFTVDVEAGDMITVSTTSARSFDLNVHTEDYSIEEYVRATGKASVTIDSDAEVIVGIDVDVPNETTEFEIELIRTSELDETETDKTLQNPECGKTYVCKATVGENDYLSDVVTVGHNIVSVDAKAPTCTEIGWEAYEYCTACDYTTYVEIPATKHKDTLVQVEGKDATCTEAGYEAYEYCTACDYTTYVEIPASHKIEKVDAKAPTCTEIGWDAYEYCSACNYTTYVEIPENGHTPLDAVRENEVAPECGVAGSYDLVVYCDDCGAELDRETVAVDALTHSFTKYEVTEEAKCGVEGKEVATCDNGCGETDEKAIDALTHTDADGDYICDHGCGYEYEKPAPEEPTPDTPDEPEDETCADCGKVHINFFSEIICFFSEIICFFTRIINFIKNLFA